jgi:hypothetical protein
MGGDLEHHGHYLRATATDFKNLFTLNKVQRPIAR